jgi:hypothetical protein
LGGNFAVKKAMKKITATESEATNLRRDLLNKQTWRRVGIPTKIYTTSTKNSPAISVEALPFARIEANGGDGRAIILLTDADNRLYYRIEQPSTDTTSKQTPEELATESAADLPELLAELPAEVMLAITQTKGVIRLMLKHQADRYLTYDADLKVTFCGAMPELPELRLTATDYNTLYATVPQLTLSGQSPGSSGSQLSSADNKLLSTALISTYEALRRQAHELGYCVQPILARYRLLDAGGNTVAVGPTVALSTAEGFSATATIIQTSTDNLQTLNETTMALACYRPAIISPSELPTPWNTLISNVVIEVTNELDPLNSSLQAPHRIQRDSSTGRITLSSRLPGFSLGMVLDSNRFHTLAIQGLTATRYIASEFIRPYNSGIALPGTLRTFQATNLTIPSSVTTAAVAMRNRSYSAATESGNVTVVCNPLTQPFYGWSPNSFIASTDTSSDGVWRLAFSVKLSTQSGEHWLKHEVGGLGSGPADFLPLLCYPSTDATELQISYLAPDGTCYAQQFPLTALPEAAIACYINPNLDRITLSQQVDSYQPQGEQQEATLQNGVADILSTNDLGNLIDSMPITNTAIHAVYNQPRGESGWDFSRKKLLFFSNNGTRLASLTAAGSFSTATTVDNRPVRSARAVCCATADNGASLMAIAGNDLIEISGQKATTRSDFLLQQIEHREPTALISDDTEIGWCDRYHELWIHAGNGRLYRLTNDNELIKADLPDINAATTLRLARWEGGLLLLAHGSGTFSLSREATSGTLPIRLRTRYQAAERPTLLTLNTFGTSLTGECTLKGDRGTEIAEMLLRVAIDGDLNAPLSLRLASPYRDFLETDISLTAGADLAILPTELR